MMPLILHGLETALNQLLRLDPDSTQRIKLLEGKCIKINISDWNISFFILPYSHGLELMTDYHKPPDTIISGTLSGLIKVGTAKASTTALFDASIMISGDTQAGEALGRILKDLEIDWEEHLSTIVGDSLAHPIAYHAKKAISSGKRSLKSLGENLSEYLHYESQQLPTPFEVEQLIQNIEQLRDDIDRIEARIHRLQARSPST